VSDDTPWTNLEKCVIAKKGGGLLVLAIMLGHEKPCDRCNESRAKCGGLPRADGDPRP
jgi:hypothetical protein